MTFCAWLVLVVNSTMLNVTAVTRTFFQIKGQKMKQELPCYFYNCHEFLIAEDDNSAFLQYIHKAEFRSAHFKEPFDLNNFLTF